MKKMTNFLCVTSLEVLEFTIDFMFQGIEYFALRKENIANQICGYLYLLLPKISSPSG